MYIVFPIAYLVTSHKIVCLNRCIECARTKMRVIFVSHLRFGKNRFRSLFFFLVRYVGSTDRYYLYDLYDVLS